MNVQRKTETQNQTSSGRRTEMLCADRVQNRADVVAKRTLAGKTHIRCRWLTVSRQKRGKGF